jgi:hypothetical protein
MYCIFIVLILDFISLFNILLSILVNKIILKKTTDISNLFTNIKLIYKN